MAFTKWCAGLYHLVFVLTLAALLVQAEECPQQKGGSASTNEKARNLAGSRTFTVFDKSNEYKYEINLCYTKEHDVAVRQETIGNSSYSWVVGGFQQDGRIRPRVFGGSDWLIIQYFGEKYGSHCGKAERKSIIYIQCDRSADTHAERKPKMIEEYRPDNPDKADEDFCYYLFEMKHDGVCPPAPPAKISPGSVFIIIIVIIGVLYLVLGLLYQRFIVGAKGMEQIPNYLMWREFGTLQADGCNFICRAKGTREPTRYKPVDDAIADDEDFTVSDEEHDDAMLPM